MKKNIFILILVIFTFPMFGQDGVFSQFYNSNGALNPALLGIFDGQQRVSIQFRDQWKAIHRSKSYNTIAAQFDAKIHTKRNDFLTYGLDFNRNQAGSSSYLEQSGHLNVGYIKQIGAKNYTNVKHFLSGGLKLGFGQNRVNVNDLWFGNQFDQNGGTIDWSSPSNESLLNSRGTSPFYGDFGMGLLYFNDMGDRKNAYFGLSASHLNQPLINLTEFGDAARLKRIVTLHGGVELPQNNELSHMLNFVMHNQSPSFMLIPGYAARYKNKDWKEIALRAGVWTRFLRVDGLTVESIIFGTTFEYESFLFGLSYDVTTTNLVRANSGRGAFEISLQYINRNTKYRSPIKCPKF